MNYVFPYNCLVGWVPLIQLYTFLSTSLFLRLVSEVIR